jgi:hypothetical protein
MIAASLFNSCYDKQPALREFADWSALVEFLKEQTTKPAYAADKERTPLISPAVYEPQSLRAKENVLAWGNWFAVDIDNKDGTNPLADIETVVAKVMERGAASFIYTTTSSQHDRQCFRLMFPTDRPVEAHEFYAVWHSVAEWLGCADKQTKDPSRMFTLPRQWADGHNVSWFTEGQPMGIDALCRDYPATQELRRAAVVNAFKVDTTDLKPCEPQMVSLYGPFVRDDVLNAAMGGAKGGRMFKFLCSVAARALFKGYAITADELADIGVELARTMGRPVSDVSHDANNALRNAYQSYEQKKATQFLRTFPTLNSKFVRK